MGEVTQVKRVLRTELCGIGGLCLHFAFVLLLPVVGFVLFQCHHSRGGVWELSRGDIGNTSLYISAIGLTGKAVVNIL